MHPGSNYKCIQVGIVKFMGCETEMRCGALFVLVKWSSGCAGGSVVPQSHELAVTAFLSELGVSCPLPLQQI